jgi:hypothetical protein
LYYGLPLIFGITKTLLQVSCDGKWIDGGNFPPSLGSFATIPKVKRSLLLNKTKYFYLDAIHMDIAFGDCLSIGGNKYALILVDSATRYDWTFGLRLLSSDCILLALRLFWASAGALARGSTRKNAIFSNRPWTISE